MSTTTSTNQFIQRHVICFMQIGASRNLSYELSELSLQCEIDIRALIQKYDKPADLKTSTFEYLIQTQFKISSICEKNNFAVGGSLVSKGIMGLIAKIFHQNEQKTLGDYICKLTNQPPKEPRTRFNRTLDPIREVLTPIYEDEEY